MILTLQFFAQGLSETCSGFRVVPHPGLGMVGVLDCESPSNLLQGTGGCVFVNADWNCDCNIGTLLTCDDLSPVEDTTWGQIKTLYRQ